MAFKYREEIVGKRFLALKSTSLTESTSDSSSDPSAKKWLAGFIRAATERDVKNPDLQVSFSIGSCQIPNTVKEYYQISIQHNFKAIWIILVHCHSLIQMSVIITPVSYCFFNKYAVAY